MRKSEIVEIAKAVEARIWENETKGHPPLAQYVSADSWETKDARTKERICRMIDFTKETVPWLTDNEVKWFVNSDEGITYPYEGYDAIGKMSRGRLEELTLLTLEHAKTHYALDCIRGRAIRTWLNKGNWKKIKAQWDRVPLES